MTTEMLDGVPPKLGVCFSNDEIIIGFRKEFLRSKDLGCINPCSDISAITSLGFKAAYIRVILSHLVCRLFQNQTHSAMS